MESKNTNNSFRYGLEGPRGAGGRSNRWFVNSKKDGNSFVRSAKPPITAANEEASNPIGVSAMNIEKPAEAKADEQKKKEEVEGESERLIKKRPSPGPAKLKALGLFNRLTENIGKSLSKHLANYIIELSNHTLIEQLEKNPDFFEFKKNTAKRCSRKLNVLFGTLTESHHKLSNFLASIAFDDNGKKILRDMYDEDIKSVVESVLKREKLFEKGTVLSKGLAKFDTISHVVESGSANRASLLDSIVTAESDDNTASALIALNQFKNEARTVVCPRVVQILLKRLDPSTAISAFSDIVNFVEKHNSLNERGSLPGSEFRDLLVDTNLKILEMGITVAGLKGTSSMSSDTASINFGVSEKRNMIKALNGLRAWKPVSTDMPSKDDTAADIILLPDTAELSNIPIPPQDLLLLTNYINSILSLEKRGIFTCGFFKSTCVIITQCLGRSGDFQPQSQLQHGTSTVTSFASRMARKNLIGLDLMAAKKRKDNKKGGSDRRHKRKRSAGEDSSNLESEYSDNNNNYSSYDSSSTYYSSSSEDEESAKEHSGQSKKHKKKQKEKLSFHTDFFNDTSIIGKDLQNFIRQKRYTSLIDYVKEALATEENGSVDGGNNVSRRLVSSLLDVLVHTLEEKDALVFKDRQRRATIPKTPLSDMETKIIKVKQDLINSVSDKTDIVKFMVADIDKNAVYKHEISSFKQNLIPSNNLNTSGIVLESFFDKHKDLYNPMEQQQQSIDQQPVARPCDVRPKLDIFADTVTRHAASIIQVFMKIAARTTSNTELTEKLSEVKVPVVDPDSRNDALKEFMRDYTSTGYRAKDIMSGRVSAVVSVSSNRTAASQSSLTPSPAMITMACSSYSKLLFPSEGSGMVSEALRWQRVINLVDCSDQTRTVIRNSSELMENENASLSMLLFSGGVNEPNYSDIGDDVSLLTNGIFSIVDATSKLIQVDTDTIVLVVDDKLLDRVVDFIFSTLNSAASVMYSYSVGQIQNQQQRQMICSPSAFDSSLSTSAECPSVISKHITTKLSEIFLKKTSDGQPMGMNQRLAETALIKEVSSRAADVVKSHLSNVVSTAVLLNASEQMQALDERTVERMGANSEHVPAKLLSSIKYTIKSELRDNRRGVIKTINRLAIFIGVLAATDMLRLSNDYFFSILNKSGVLSGVSDGVTSLVTESSSTASHLPRTAWLHTALNRTLMGKKAKSKNFPVEREENDIMSMLNSIV